MQIKSSLALVFRDFAKVLSFA